MRSTPIPWLAILRTVKVCLRPAPFIPITMPSNAWARTLSPSTTLTTTRTVSPGRKSGTFSLSCSFSIALIRSNFNSSQKSRRQSYQKPAIVNDSFRHQFSDYITPARAR